MGRRKIVFQPPVLKDRGGDLSKDWFVEYEFRDPRSDELVRKRTSKGLNFFLETDEQTRKARQEKGDEIVKKLEEKIKKGWNPIADYESQYSDHLEYSQIEKVYGRLKKSRRNIRKTSSQFLETIKITRRDKTYRGFQSKLRRLVNWCESKKLDEIDISQISNKHIKDFFIFLCSELDLDKRTVKKYRQNIRQYFNYLIAEKIIKSNPVFDVLIPAKKVDAAARPILKEHLELLLKHIEFTDPQLFLACLFQYYTAIRPGEELLNLKICDIDFYNCSITIPDIEAKKERHETIDMPIQLRDLCINRYLLHTFNSDFYVFGRLRIPGPDPVGKNTLRNRFNIVRDILKFPKHYKYYSMKHTGAGRFLDNGATLPEVQNHLRHKDISDTQAYVKRHFGDRNEKVIHKFPDHY